MSKFIPVVALAVLCLAPSAQAETSGTDAVFALRLFGIRVGTLEMQGQEGDGTYRAQAHFATKGLAGAVARVRFDMQAEGHQSGATLTPGAYTGDIDTGRDKRSMSTQFSANDRRLDPMTALYLGLRDRPADQGCALTGTIYDGKKTQEIELSQTANGSRGITCAGRLDRKDGYTAEDMAEVSGFPMRIEYRRDGDTLRAQTATIQSLHGRVVLERQ